MELDEKTEIAVQQAFTDALNLFNNDKTIESINKCIEGINMLPGKPYQYDIEYTFLETLCNHAYVDGLLDIVDEWLEIFLICDNKLRGYGNSEFLAGQMAYDRNDVIKARDFFFIADEKSGGRVWRKSNLDPKYFMFFKKK